MRQDPHAPALFFPNAQPPEPSTLVEIAPGVQWCRLPLPYRLDHVNIYLIEDDDGWTVLDTGLGTDDCRTAWDDPARAARRAAPHLDDRDAFPSRPCRPCGLARRSLRPAALDAAPRVSLQPGPAICAGRSGRRHAPALLPPPRTFPEVTEAVLGRGHEYLRQTTGVPTTYHRIQHGDSLRIGRGHSR